MVRAHLPKVYYFGMEKEKPVLYTDYLICNRGFATATGLSAMLGGDMSHGQLECLKIKHKANHFALQTKLFIKANQMAYEELQKLRAA